VKSTVRPRAGTVVGALLLGAILAGLLAGPAHLSPTDVLRGLLGAGGDTTNTTIVRSIRLPRLVAGLLVGSGLAVSGAIFQALLRNPLAEPYLLGVSSGAAVGAVAALATGLAVPGGAGVLALPLAALAGGLVAIAIVFRVARVTGGVDTRVLILAGVVVSAFFGACIALMLTFLPPERLRTAFFWSLGGLDGISWTANVVLGVYVIPSVLLACALARDLDALAVGEEPAAALGTDVERTKRRAYFLASLLAAATVSVAGVIGFVGLVVPHAVRLTGNVSHRRLLPLAALAGGAFLALADAGARVVAAPAELPVGVVTAFVGVPFFLALLRRSGQP
jgi:iron complex transport system permease protein